MSAHIVDLTGQRFGLLTAISHAEMRHGAAYWHCLCACGGRRVVAGNNLRRGLSTSCGCKRIATLKAKMKTHGHASGVRSSAYVSWCQMRQRCSNHDSPVYAYYGGRGIGICPEWNSFERFYQDMGDRPKGHTLERLDVNGNYEPANCVWATRTQQSRNRRYCRHVLLDGTKMLQADAARALGVSQATVHRWMTGKRRMPNGLTMTECY